jgi:uncharacterized Zn-finger protein
MVKHYTNAHGKVARKVLLIDAAFTRPYNLKSHYRGHLGEKPFRCDVPQCDASFARKHDLKRHILSHSYE